MTEEQLDYLMASEDDEQESTGQYGSDNLEQFEKEQKKQ